MAGADLILARLLMTPLAGRHAHPALERAGKIGRVSKPQQLADTLNFHIGTGQQVATVPVAG